MFGKIFDWYKKLPKEAQILLVLLGLGTPVGIIYFLRDMIGLSLRATILILVGVVVVCLLLSMLLSRLFGRRGRKRSREMDRELTAEGRAGPVSMDVSAAIKENNKKFKSAVEEMRKEFRVSVYEMPWYIVIGDSGCGKTVLVNQSGLTFSGGKPEGYQLGTLNYNWWFTEEAILIDMAGRLCNPQEDADYQEWKAFLNTIARGRKGWPINGAIVCVSAEHLLSDAPEKHEENANIALERLRELQKHLGVTFATHLVVTKCDKILGFMPFFDRADRDVSMKNQIFGWSRPGAFHEHYDPERFEQDFNALYGRLNDLRLRRLNDEDEEAELGLAYTFPEEFRELKKPLMTYVRALFPLMKNPRAVKNLIFRGVYFTSATQKGSVILKHLSERLGGDAATSFAPLEDLYPNPRPHFLKDLLIRKVFPEQGLVFRNEQQAMKHRKLARMFLIASIALPVVALVVLLWAGSSFRALIKDPKEIIVGVPEEKVEAKAIVQRDVPSEMAVLHAALKKSRENLGSLWPGTILSFGRQGQVRQDIELVAHAVFEQGVLRQAIREVERRLAAGAGLKDVAYPAAGTLVKSDEDDADRPARLYAQCAEEYLYLAGSEAGEGMAGHRRGIPGADRFMRMFKLIEQREGQKVVVVRIADMEAKEFEKSLRDYLAAAGDGSKGLDPRKLMENPQATARATVMRMREYLSRLARFDQDHPSDDVPRWLVVRENCEKAATAYGKILAQSDSFETVGSEEALKQAKQAFAAPAKEMADALDAIAAALAGTGPSSKPMRTMKEAVAAARRVWLDVRDDWHHAYSGKDFDAAAGRPEAGEDALAKAIASLVRTPASRRDVEAAGGDGLDNVLAEALRKLRCEGESGAAKSVDELLKDPPEMAACGSCKDVIAVGATGRPVATSGPGAVTGPLSVSAAANAARNEIEAIGGRLAALGAPLAEEAPREPLSHLAEMVRLAAPPSPTETQPSGGALARAWRGEQLATLSARVTDLANRAALGRELTYVQGVLEAAGRQEWGIGWLEEHGDERVGGYYTIEGPPGREKAARAAAPGPVQPAARGGRRPAPRRPGAGARGAAKPPPAAPLRPTGSAKGLAEAATARYLGDALVSGLLLESTVHWATEELDDGDGLIYGTTGGLRSGCLNALRAAEDKYLQTYFGKWRDAYGKQTVLKGAADLLSASDWPRYKDVLRTAGPELARQFTESMQDIEQHVFAAAVSASDGADEAETRALEARQGRLDAARSANWASPSMRMLSPLFEQAGARDTAALREIRSKLDGYWKVVPDYRHPLEAGAVPGMSMPAGVRFDVVPRELVSACQQTTTVDEVVRKGRTLLNKDVHNALVARQNESLGITGQTSGDRWRGGLPFEPTAEAPFRTIVPATFSAFIGRIVETEVLLKDLEPMLQSCDGHEARAALYRSCREWLRLIGNGDIQKAYHEEDSKLRVTLVPIAGSAAAKVWNATTRSAGQKPPAWSEANLHPRVMVDLALRQADAAQPGFVFEVTDATDPATAHAAKNQPSGAWFWPSSSAGLRARAALRGFNTIDRQTDVADIEDIDLSAGVVDQLWLIGFLNAAGSPDNAARDQWRVAIEWDLPTLLKDRNRTGDVPKLNHQRAGCYLLIKLDRPIPNGIAPLQLLP